MSEIIQIDIDKITPYHNNPRYNENAVDAVANSISTFGFLNPLVVNKDFVIINGHTRYKAAQKLKLKQIPCIVVEDLSPEDEKAYRIADNKTSEDATWDYEKLVLEIKELKNSDVDINSLAFANELLEDLLYYSEEDIIWDGEIDPDIIPEISGRIVSKKRARYQLGDHILQVGENSYTLMGNESASIYMSRVTEDIASKIKDGSAFLTGVFYILAPDSCLLDIYNACEQNGLDVHEKLVWTGSQTSHPGSNYVIKNESVFYGWQKCTTHRWFNDRKQNNVLNFENKVNDSVPVDLWVYLLRNSSQRGDIILDNNSSDGAVLIACERTGRKCRLITSTSKEADTIRKRWASFVYGDGCDWQHLTPEIK